MKIKEFQFNMFGVNTYVVWDETSRECVIVDPGMISDYDNHVISDFIQSNNLTVKHLVNTHLHIDHTLGNDFVAHSFQVKTKANKNDEFLGQQRLGQARMFGLGLKNINPIEIIENLKNGDKLEIGSEYLNVLEVPGHSPGSIALYSPTGNFVITGDALFNGSIGRTDLPGGNHAQLIESLTKTLFTLPDSTIVYPGHGPTTTIGYEKRMNPYI